MKTTYHVEGTQAYFTLSDLTPVYQEAASSLEFTRGDNETYHLSFPVHTPDLERIYQHFERSIEEMLLQTADMHPVPWEQALTAFLERLAFHSDISWWLVGSTALAVRGIDVIPHDIDIAADDAGSHKLNTMLLDVLTQPLQETPGWIANTFGRAFLHARVEWVGGVDERAVDMPEVSDFGRIARSRQEIVHWRGYELCVPPLDLQLLVNERRDRMERAEKIRRFMSK